MAQNTDLVMTEGEWTLLTNADVTNVRIQNLNHERSGNVILLQATSDTSAPADPPVGALGAVRLMPGSVFPPDVTVADMWPGVSGADRVWAWGAGKVSVSHA